MIEMYWNAILGLQSGQHEPVIKVIEQTGANYKDTLWSVFRTFASNKSIMDQIDNKLSGLEDFETFYTDFLSVQDYQNLRNKMREMPDIQCTYERIWY
jgi:hypothetical protein